MDSLIAHAEAMGLYVAWRPLGRAAYYQHSASLIVLSTRVPQWRARQALCHELGHVHHGHAFSRDHDLRREEDEADSYAAELLISAVDYALAESLVGEHPGALAKELGVTRRLVELRRQQFERDRRILQVVDEWRSA